MLADDFGLILEGSKGGFGGPVAWRRRERLRWKCLRWMNAAGAIGADVLTISSAIAACVMTCVTITPRGLPLSAGPDCGVACEHSTHRIPAIGRRSRAIPSGSADSCSPSSRCVGLATSPSWFLRVVFGVVLFMATAVMVHFAWLTRAVHRNPALLQQIEFRPRKPIPPGRRRHVVLAQSWP